MKKTNYALIWGVIAVIEAIALLFLTNGVQKLLDVCN